MSSSETGSESWWIDEDLNVFSIAADEDMSVWFNAEATCYGPYSSKEEAEERKRVLNSQAN